MKKFFSLMFATLMGATLLFSCDGIDTMNRDKEEQQNLLVGVSVYTLYQQNLSQDEQIKALQAALAALTLRVEAIEADYATKVYVNEQINILSIYILGIVNANEQECEAKMAQIWKAIFCISNSSIGRDMYLQMQINSMMMWVWNIQVQTWQNTSDIAVLKKRVKCLEDFKKFMVCCWMPTITSKISGLQAQIDSINSSIANLQIQIDLLVAMDVIQNSDIDVLQQDIINIETQISIIIDNCGDSESELKNYLNQIKDYLNSWKSVLHCHFNFS